MKMYGSEICGGCRAFKALMAERGIEGSFEIVDITANVPNLRAFLALRDNEKCFEEVRAAGRIGIPCFVNDEGEVTVDENTALAWIGQPPMEPAAPGCASCK